MTNKFFFQNLKASKTFAESLIIADFHQLPDDWYIIVTDVKGSTKAIEAGRYREVNAIGAAAIAVITDIDPDLELPFVFGGDGSTILIPEELLKKSQIALKGLQIKAKMVDLDLRVGVFSTKELYSDGFSILLNKWKAGPRFSQATIIGTGLDEAEKRLKSNDRYLLTPEIFGKDRKVEGFTCRWEPVKSPKEKILSVVIKLRDSHSGQTLKQIILKIEKIFGHPDSHHPLLLNNINLALNPKHFQIESLVGSKTPTWLIFIQQMYGIIIERLNLKALRNKETIKNLKTFAFDNSDYKKFDGTLKFIIAATNQEYLDLEAFLKLLKEENKLFYGIQVSDSSLITCVVSKKNKKEVHFIDGNNGGYTLAAKKMKLQINKI